MSKLLDRSLKQMLIYAGLVVACSIPVYYIIISKLWKYELDEHKITLTAAAEREDSFLIIAAVTQLSLLFFGRESTKQKREQYRNTLPF